ncbi:hypothetical protein [Sulfitobacter aestuariivivens]|uniref:Uncharacterized protein n=1 Tax=Sulfitobacter aestuariivivens TaxID=2766981 RepID=A0A927D707_9RHOB|nr:hypothetical protein [Sulfitobacter aestuariivivens]MBD3664697.1 hypothetical protein [Sulfitobacter aestuariivivens]
MPHAEIRYSNDLLLDATSILRRVEEVIQSHDAGSGECKGRAYPAAEFHHTHVLIQVSMLPKPHRDDAFLSALLNDLETQIKALLPGPCLFSLGITFSGAHYVTNHHP